MHRRPNATVIMKWAIKAATAAQETGLLAAAVFTMRIHRNEVRHKTVTDLKTIGLAAFAFKRALASRTIETGDAV
jgi:hypothetical protein